MLTSRHFALPSNKPAFLFTYSFVTTYMYYKGKTCFAYSLLCSISSFYSHHSYHLIFISHICYPLFTSSAFLRHNCLLHSLQVICRTHSPSVTPPPNHMIHPLPPVYYTPHQSHPLPICNTLTKSSVAPTPHL